MASRTLGWIQNPSSIESLKNTVGVFLKDSQINISLRTDKLPRLIDDVDMLKKFLNFLNQDKIEIPYADLKGKGAGGASRKNAKCSGIIQAAIHSQNINKEYVDDWSADGFLRWAISIGFLAYNSKLDICSITKLGESFVLSKNDSQDEKDILGRAYLSYPPAVRVLSLLSKEQSMTKFEIGSQLGFIGEAGFTSIPQNIYVYGYCTANKEQQKSIRSDQEGSSDKYARMICSWFIKIGWVIESPKTVTVEYANQKYTTTIGHSFSITLEGVKNLKRAYGTSSSSRIDKIVYYEMLATKTNDKDYLRSRRANIIKFIENKEKHIEVIQEYLKNKGFDEHISTIQDDLLGLSSIGLNVQKNKSLYKINDKITKLEVPLTIVEKTDLTIIKDKIREKLKTVNHKYLNLIDLSFDGKSNRDFEIQTIDLLTNELDFLGVRLGDTRKPDGIISHDKNGVIIDNKAYSSGYSLPISQADEMIRYIDENKERDSKFNNNCWWNSFNPSVDRFYFLFISSIFSGSFAERLKHISHRTNINGGALNSENLLYIAEALKSGDLSYDNFFGFFKNEEILYDDIS